MSFFDDASWVLIPEGIKEDVVYAQKPTNGLGDLTFTRASDATRTNSAGVIERTPWNLVTFSEMFSDVAWTKTRSTVTANTITAPNGTLTADTWTGDGASGGKYVIQTAAIVSGRSYSVSIYAKKNTNNFIQLFAGTATFGPGAYANFDLNNGVLGTVGAAATATIESVGDGWYRCVVTATSTVTTTGNAHVVSLITSATSPENEINTLSTSVFLWGAQMVEGTDAKPYFATTNRQDVPRLHYRNADGTVSTCPRLLLEPQRTNSIRNSSMVGAVAGSPGTLPTNYSEFLAGLTRSVVAVGTENGLPYLDVQFSGTATGDLFLRYESATAIVAANTQTWTVASYLKFINQPAPPSFTVFSMIERTSGGSFITSATSSALSVTSSLNRFSFTRTLAGGATVGAIQPQLAFILNVGQTYNFTIRIAAPQMELGGYATTWVPTTTAAVTRLADFASKTGVSSLIGQSQGTLFVEVNTAVLGNVFSGTGRRFLTISDNTINNRIIIFQNATNDFIQVVVVNGGVEQANISTSTNQSGIKKIAAAYANNDFVLYINGVQIGTDTSGTVPSCDRIALGFETISNLSNPACPVAQAALFPTRLTNAQLAQLTTL